MDKKISLDLNDLLLVVYNKIAKWHNDDSTAEGLKVTSHEIIETVLTSAFQEFNAKFSEKVETPTEEGK